MKRHQLATLIIAMALAACDDYSDPYRPPHFDGSTQHYTDTAGQAKWNLLEGMATLSDDFCLNKAWQVQVMQRDDDHSRYRIMTPYGLWADSLNGSQSDYLELHILKKGDRINGITMKEDGIVDWHQLCTGYVHPVYGTVVWALHPQELGYKALDKADVYACSRVTAYMDDGTTPGKIQLAPYWYMDRAGGWNETLHPTLFLQFPGYVEQLPVITYSIMGNGVYTYGISKLSQTACSFYEGSEEGTLYRCDQRPDEYYLKPWANSEAGLAFTVQQDGTIKFNQATGDVYEAEGTTYGAVYFTDIETFDPQHGKLLGKYDEEKGLFEFVGIYHIPSVAGFGFITETFQLNR